MPTRSAICLVVVAARPWLTKSSAAASRISSRGATLGVAGRPEPGAARAAGARPPLPACPRRASRVCHANDYRRLPPVHARQPP